MKASVIRLGIPRAQRLALLDVVTVEKINSFGENLLPLQTPTDVPVRYIEAPCGMQVVDWKLGDHLKYECMKRPVVLQLQDGIKLLSSELMENAEGSRAAVESSTEAAAAKVSDALLKAGLAAMMKESDLLMACSCELLDRPLRHQN